MRLMSFSMTTPQIRDRSKTVTRRLGWKSLEAGTKLWAVEKCQGLKKGEKVKRICMIEVINVSRETLDWLLTNPHYGYVETLKEGYPDMTPIHFIDNFCIAMGATSDTEVTRIEFKYLRGGDAT